MLAILSFLGLLWFAAGIYTAAYQLSDENRTTQEVIAFSLFCLGIGPVGLVLFTPVGRWINKQYMRRNHDSAD